MLTVGGPKKRAMRCRGARGFWGAIAKCTSVAVGKAGFKIVLEKASGFGGG